MPVVSVEKDLDALTLTIVAEFAAPLQRVWDAYADPRQIEKFWGPTTWPATFTRHDMSPGGRSTFVMTGPDGETSAGTWEFVAVEAPHSFEVLDGFAHVDGTPNTDLPSMRMVYSFEATDTGTRMTARTWFNSLDELQQLLEMGMEEGTLSAMSQIDGVIADGTSFTPDQATAATHLIDAKVRITRIIRGGSVEDVWRAHHDPTLVRQWMLGPAGWEMPVCDVATEPGEPYRYEWQQVGGTERFGFVGELIEAIEPVRAVTTERILDTDGPSTTNELTLTPVAAGVLVSTVITYPSEALRDEVLGTGMVDGMEFGYQRLESLL